MPRIVCLMIITFFLISTVAGFGGELDTGKDVPLEEKIAQMLMVGFRGTQLPVADWVTAAIKEQHIGGVILFDYDVKLESRRRNILSPEQLHDLTTGLQNLSAQPLLIAVDQEGGRVARLNETNGFPHIPSPRSIGQQQNQVAAAGRIASMLSASGINLNLAPVVDLCVNPENPVIARLDRCYSDDPKTVAAMATTFIGQHRQQHVLTALKHFPGHGSSLTDSHLGFTDISDTWSAKELVPYRKLIAADMVDMIMVAHVFNRNIDENFPASLSAKTIDGLLRQELGFDGVVISDDLQMGALSDHYTFENILLQAIRAGNDILIFGNNLHYDPDIVTKAIEVIKAQVRDGRLDRKYIDESYQRIVQLKEKLRK